MALYKVDRQAQTLTFAGAKNPLVYIQDGELHHIKGDRKAIGGQRRPNTPEEFASHTISIAQPTTVYVFSDGYQDQFGGAQNRKFMIKRMKQLLLEHHQEPMETQQHILETELAEWMGNHKQIDDILVIGAKIS